MTPRNLMSDFCKVDESNSSPCTRSKLNSPANNNSIYTSYHKSKSREKLCEENKTFDSFNNSFESQSVFITFISYFMDFAVRKLNQKLVFKQIKIKKELQHAFMQ